jgi:hypothetical protein
MPQFIDGPPITPGTVAATGVPAPGSKEIFIDSSAIRSAYFQQYGVPDVAPSEPADQEQPAVQEVRTVSVPDEAIPPEVMAAMRAGVAPSTGVATQMAALARAHQGPVRTQPISVPQISAPHSSAPPAQATSSMILPLGSGLSVELRFIGGEPTPAHWRRLLRHLQIEAESGTDS